MEIEHLHSFFFFFVGQALEFHDLALKAKSRPMKLNFNGRNGIGINRNFLSHLGSMKYPPSIFDAQEKSLPGNENRTKRWRKTIPENVLLFIYVSPYIPLGP